MSETINNREYRQKVLKELIMELHAGKSVDEVKSRFADIIEGVSTKEISEMENALIAEGMPVEEIQNLCDVHAAVFEGSIEEIHRPQKEDETPGHPVHTFKMENRALEKLINEKLLMDKQQLGISNDEDYINYLRENLNLLGQIDKHYSRKENLLFPFMERYGITAPPKVMWGVDDEIRADIKNLSGQLADLKGNMQELQEKVKAVTNRVIEMISKEENILFPLVLETLSEDDWLKVEEGSDEVGYCLVNPDAKWKPVRVDLEEEVTDTGVEQFESNYVKFDAGLMLPEEVNAMLNTLPIDITFVDKDGVVKYFSQGKERIFPRPKTIIGRTVQNCHPPASVHIVEGIVEDLKSGKKDHEDFWIKKGDIYVYIRYFAVRNDKGEYLGTVEVSQNIKPIQELSGEKRLVE